MSRKSVRSRGASVATGATTTVMPVPFPQSGGQAGSLLDADDARTQRLLAFTPRGPRAIIKAVEAAVILVILRVPFVSAHSDKQMLGATYRYAIECVRRRGVFDPTVDLRDDLLVDYVQSIGHRSTRDTHLSVLRRVRLAGKPRQSSGAHHALAPYTPAEWDRIWESTLTSGVRDALLMVSLLGRLGLRPGETHKATPAALLQSGRRICIRAYGPRAVVRLVPADTEAAKVLAPFIDSDREFLLRPEYKSREGLISRMMWELRRESPEFAALDARRLRHTAIAAWMRMPIPFTALTQVAGISSQSHLAADIVNQMETPDEVVSVHRFFAAMGVDR